MNNAVIPYQRGNQQVISGVDGLGHLVLHLNFRMYRADVVDYCCTSIFRVVNAVFRRVFTGELLHPDTMKTQKQLEREQEAVVFRLTLGEESATSRFALHTALFLGDAIPTIAAEKRERVPPFVEGWGLYRMGLLIRYFNRQLINKTGYREALLASRFTKTVQARYCSIMTELARQVLGRHNLEPLINFEHLLLQMFVKLKNPEKKGALERCASAGISALAKSLSYEEDIEAFLEKQPLKTEEEVLIARLEWHADHGSLPKGAPDPRVETLTTGNVYEKYEEAASNYLEGVMKVLVERFAPPSVKRWFSFSGVFYFLEGKDAATKGLTMMGQWAVKQIADPHLFAVAVLNATNQDVIDYELDGFGTGSKETVLEVGREMMNADMSWQETLSLFETSGLRHAPQGLEGIKQKHATKEALRQYIAGILHEAIKEEDFQHPGGVLRTVRRKTKGIPLMGAATISLDVGIKGLVASLSYLVRDSKHGEMPFLSWMFKHMSGKGLCNFLADRVVDLIYNPAWKIMLLQVFQDTWEAFLQEGPPGDIAVSREDFKAISHFLVAHFVSGNEHLFAVDPKLIFDFFAGDMVYDKFKGFLQPSEASGLDVGLEALLPIIKELHLGCRVVDVFRKKGIAFPGDAKFWEVFLRESLSELVGHNLASAELVAARERLLDRLLALDDAALCEYFSKPLEELSLLEDWEEVPRPPEEAKVPDCPNQFYGNEVDWGYDPQKMD